jgi:hypothetical protein
MKSSKLLEESKEVDSEDEYFEKPVLYKKAFKTKKYLVGIEKNPGPVILLEESEDAEAA